MNNSMLDFVLRNVPDNWDEVVSYDSSYILFELHPYDKEYTKIRNLFESFEVTSIKRVQNPFQYGRFKLRHEMIRDSYVEEKTVFHVVHQSDLDIALRHTCDYRRYSNKNGRSNTNGKQPSFFRSPTLAVNNSSSWKTSDIIVFVVSMISRNYGMTTETQSDYYVQYIVKLG